VTHPAVTMRTAQAATESLLGMSVER
jgi:hypothetical protein